MRTLHIGLTDKQRKGSVEALNTALGNAMLLVVKTKKAHWDVVGPQFRALHTMLDEQYAKVNEFVDAIAERIRALGGFPIATMKGFLEVSTLKEEPEGVPNPKEAVSILLDDHEAVIRHLRTAAESVESECGDRGTADFLTGIFTAHEEMAWMLRAFL
ncbi:MAG: DNA starvation/stationary phase protection protein, partial [Myxococcales bacterium]|nr:DNA starvation/stationary phase protection protein [Myxococcales bacterium]